MNTIEKAIEILQGAITTIDAKQWKAIKQETDPLKVVRIASESQALQSIDREIRKILGDIEK